MNARAQFGLTPLHLACQRGNLDAVTTLLKCKQGIDVYIGNDNDDTPLHEACLNGHHEIVYELLEYMQHASITSFNPLNGELKSPLHFACHEGHVEVVSMLLKHADYDSKKLKILLGTEDNEKNTALHLACESGDVRIVSILLAMGANVHALKLGDVSPIHLAARYGFKDIAKELMTKGEDILNMVDFDHQTPLHYAAAQNQVDMIKFLLLQYEIAIMTIHLNHYNWYCCCCCCCFAVVLISLQLMLKPTLH